MTELTVPLFGVTHFSASAGWAMAVPASSKAAQRIFFINCLLVGSERFRNTGEVIDDFARRRLMPMRHSFDAERKGKKEAVLF
jgi:hypothetical protein